MASYLIRRSWFGWNVGAAKPGNPAMTGYNKMGGQVATINYDEPLRAAPAIGQFTAKVNGVARTVNAVSVSGSKLLVTLNTPAIPGGAQVQVTYVANVGVPAGRLADVAANFAPNFVQNITA